MKKTNQSKGNPPRISPALGKPPKPINLLKGISTSQLKAELRRREAAAEAKAYKAHMAKPYKKGKREITAEMSEIHQIPAQKHVPCFPACRQEDIWDTGYFSECNVCGKDWT